MSTCQMISDSLRRRVLDSVSQLTCRNQVPGNIMSSLISGGIDPLVGPSLEDMKQLLVDAFRVFDRKRATSGEVPTKKTGGLFSDDSPRAFSDNSAAVGAC